MERTDVKKDVRYVKIVIARSKALRGGGENMSLLYSNITNKLPIQFD